MNVLPKVYDILIQRYPYTGRYVKVLPADTQLCRRSFLDLYAVCGQVGISAPRDLHLSVIEEVTQGRVTLELRSHNNRSDVGQNSPVICFVERSQALSNQQSYRDLDPVLAITIGQMFSILAEVIQQEQAKQKVNAGLVPVF